MRQWTGSGLVQVMACRLFGAKPLPEPMLAYCQLDSQEQISVKLESEFYDFHSMSPLKLSSAHMAPILSRGRWVKGDGVAVIALYESSTECCRGLCASRPSIAEADGGCSMTRMGLGGPSLYEDGRTNIYIMTSSNRNISALLAICAGNSPVSGEFSAQRPVTRSFAIFFDLCLNKRLRKQSWDGWFETLSRSLWRHYDANFYHDGGIICKRFSHY